MVESRRVQLKDVRLIGIMPDNDMMMEMIVIIFLMLWLW